MKDSEKISEIIKHTGLNGPQLAERLGYKRAQSVYFIRDGERPITLELARKIKKEWPEISFDYLVKQDHEGGLLEADSAKVKAKKVIEMEEVKELKKEISRLQKQVDMLMEQGLMQLKIIEALEGKVKG